MLVLLLILATVLGSASALELQLQVCHSKQDGGLACLCTATHAALVGQVLEVDCSSRDISTLPTEWQMSQDARSLDLSRNGISLLVKEQLPRWVSLEELNLSRNKFTTFNENVFLDLTNLRVLDLSYNMLTSLPENIFSGLSALSTLKLEMNRLQDIHPQAFVSTPQLDSLTLGYNPDLGKSVMKSPGFLTLVIQRNISSLALNNIGIEKLPPYLFNGAVNLRHLSLADNPMQFVDFFPPSLETLNLSGTDIEVIRPGDFISYPNLKKLQLDRLVHLRTVEISAFEGLQSLEVLTMENCIQLYEIDEQAFGVPESVPVPLQWLSLSRSGLHTLSRKTVMPLEQTLRYLSLQGNPWRCDCKLSWISQITYLLEDTEYLRCFSPAEHRNKLLLSVDPKDFVCTEESSNKRTYSTVIVALDILLIVVVLVVCGVGLTILRHRGLLYCIPKQRVGDYTQVIIEPNRAELEWDDRDLDNVWITPVSKTGP